VLYYIDHRLHACNTVSNHRGGRHLINYYERHCTTRTISLPDYFWKLQLFLTRSDRDYGVTVDYYECDDAHRSVNDTVVD